MISVEIVRNSIYSTNNFQSIYSKYLKNKEFSSLDIRFIMELSKGTIRMWRRINHEISKSYDGKIKKLEKLYLTILSIGVYQLDYMSKIPDYAVVATSVDITKKKFPKYSSLTNALLRAMIDEREVLNHPSDESSDNYLSIYYSYPEWLVRKWRKTYNYKDLVDLLEYGNQSPKIWFRYNKSKIQIDTFESQLKDKEIRLEKHHYLDSFFTIKNPSRLLNSSFFNKGGVFVQSIANGLVIKLLNPLKGERITDLCAAPGGKAIAISEQVSSKGKVLAYDVSRKRLERLNNSISKQRIGNIKTEVKDSSKDILRDSSKMIADVPCLSTGTISKNVDLKWKKTVDDLDRLTNLQEQILNNSVKYLRLNGVIVYSTCSIEQEENWMIIDKFLNKHPNYIIDNAKKYVDPGFTDDRGAINIKPQTHNIDGGFAVRLINSKK